MVGGWRGEGGRREIGYGEGESGHIIEPMSPTAAKRFNLKQLIRSYRLAATPEMREMGRSILTRLAEQAEGRKWWAMEGSNLRPPGCKPDALAC